MQSNAFSKYLQTIQSESYPATCILLWYISLNHQTIYYYIHIPDYLNWLLDLVPNCWKLDLISFLFIYIYIYILLQNQTDIIIGIIFPLSVTVCQFVTFLVFACFWSSQHSSSFDQVCCEYTTVVSVWLCSYTLEKQEQQSTIKKRKPTKDTDSDSVEDVPPVGQTKQVTFEVQPLRNVTTDFCGDGAFQKCVRFSPDGSILATGGGDGHLRVWKVYS